MMISREQKRLNAIKEIYPILHPVTCKCCKNDFVREKVFKVNRWGVNHLVFTWHYCKNCTKTREDVLNEIDTDSCWFGIAYVDEQMIHKKDVTRMNEKLLAMMGGGLK